MAKKINNNISSTKTSKYADFGKATGGNSSKWQEMLQQSSRDSVKNNTSSNHVNNKDDNPYRNNHLKHLTEEKKRTDSDDTISDANANSGLLKQKFAELFNNNASISSGQKAAGIAGLDGLRSLAIIGVILYHLSFSWAKGGLIGVTIFFVLSGYLITGIILNEIDSTGRFNIKRFWTRRIRRLFPAICVVIVLLLLLFSIFNHVLLTKMKPDVVPSLLWFQNWWYVFRGLSYFENLGDPSPLIHFWSLAIEEQFYLVWPIILLILKKLKVDNNKLLIVCVCLAVLSAVEMFVIYSPDTDPTRVYYGTDTRAFSLLIGAALAIIFPWQKRNDKSLIVYKYVNKLSNPEKIIEIAGVGSVVFLVLIMIFVDGVSPLMYQGMLFIVSVVSALLIFCIVFPGVKFKAIFNNKPMVWIGRRSYGIYLWHFPLILLLKPFSGGHADTWWVALLVIALSFAIAAVQYKFVEQPCRRGAIGKIINLCKESELFKKQISTVVTCVGAASLCIVLVAFMLPEQTIIPEGAIGDSNKDASVAQVETSSQQANQVKYSPILIGDSVPSSNQFTAELQQKMPSALNDSAVSRTTENANLVLQDYINRGVVGDIVVIACFSNHLLKDNDLPNLYSTVGQDRQLVLVNCFTPNPYTDQNNKMISDFANSHSDNVHVIDWYKYASENRDGFVYPDGIHLTPAGTSFYVDLVVNTSKDLQNKKAEAQRQEDKPTE